MLFLYVKSAFYQSCMHTDWGESLTAMAVLANLIPDSRYKGDFKKIIYPTDVRTFHVCSSVVTHFNFISV